MRTLTLDIESTGLPAKELDYKVDFMHFPYIVSLAYKIDAEETNYFIINQEGREIPPESTKIHKITNEIANASPHKLEFVLVRMLALGSWTDICIGHNIYFDTSIIKANVLRLISEGKLSEDCYAKFEAILHKDKRVDTMMNTIKFCGLSGKWPKLTELYFKLFGRQFNAHNSKDDVDATYECYVELVKRGVIK